MWYGSDMPRGRKDTKWRARVGGGGWVEVELAGAEHLLVRVAADKTGRYRIRELHLFDRKEPVTPDRLRRIRLAAIEDLLNLPEERATIARLIDTPATVDLEKPLRGFAVPQAAGITHEKTGGARLNPSGSAQVSRGLGRPARRGYQDDFYERVVRVYRDAKHRGDHRPVMAVAAEAGVPRTTAARWVKEARRRKLLGPAPAPGKGGE